MRVSVWLGGGLQVIVAGHDGDELLLIDLPVLVLVELVDHRLQLVIRQVLPPPGNGPRTPTGMRPNSWGWAVDQVVLEVL